MSDETPQPGECEASLSRYFYTGLDRSKLSADLLDRDVLVEGIRLAREIGSTTAFAHWRRDEVYPGTRSVSVEEIHAFISRAANSFHHPVGTCRIGKVVDDTLHVKGIAGLRVVDASVMPGIPQAVINAATIAVAERASDLILAH